MYSFYQRATTFLSTTIVSLVILLSLCYCSTFFLVKERPQVEINFSQIELLRARETRNSPFSQLVKGSYDLTMNFTPLFDWYTKQIFAYLVVEYPSDKNRFNQIVIWDKIVTRGGDYKLDVKSLPEKYPLIDDGMGMAMNNNVTLTLYWEWQPYAGPLHYDGHSKQFIKIGNIN
ncbi:signal peptidase complex subunit 3-like [Zophobas morio]|uniref:signal peptidase complex subunit 3-like n=1 Tax=Zophobas morio TaxID=2755281 RepID=UPI00308341BA